MTLLTLTLLITSAAPPPVAAKKPTAAELIDESARAIVAEPITGAPSARNTWDKKSDPRFFELVNGRFPLNDAEVALLHNNGFVVAPRFRQTSFHETLHELHTSQLPVFISTDAVLHGIFRSNDAFLIDLEREVLAPSLVGALKKMHDALPQARKLWPATVGKDVDLYLRLARLIAVDDRLTATPDERAWLTRIRKASTVEKTELFGRMRNVDFTQYKPRGHYADERHALQDYFRLVMWLSRLELNLKSNACASSHPGPDALTEETPREVLVALALAELAERSGTLAEWQRLDRAFGLLAGKREDVSFEQLNALRKEAGVAELTAPDAAAKVSAAIGDRFHRTVNFHRMPPDVPVRPLPVIATFLGPRITPEAEALGPLTFQMEPVGWAAILGHRRALDYAKLKKEPQAQVEDAQRRLAAARFGDDTYSTWLKALVLHGAAQTGVLPSFTATPAWQDFRVNTSLVGFAQLRHNYVLYAAQTEEEGGCQIPDGFVEPSVRTYEALAAYARSGQALLKELDASARKLRAGAAYFPHLERTLNVLAALSRQELNNQPLSADGQRFMSMVVETWALRNMYGRDAPAQHDGWYFDLFYGNERDFGPPASGPASFIADLHTQEGRIAYAGARLPELGFFVVDTSGPPRLMVGPVARGFEAWGERGVRFSDDDVARDPGERRFVTAPWAESYRATGPQLRSLTLLNDGSPAWSAVALLQDHSPRDYGTGYEQGNAPPKGPVTFRVRGVHGEELLSTVVEKGARFVIPKQHRAAARLVSAECAGEVVEAVVWRGGH